MRPTRLVVFLMVVLGAGCSGNSTNGGGSGGSAGSDAGVGGSGGSAAAAGSGGTAGSPGSGGAAGSSCHGDAAKWAALPGSGSCTKNSDCCVIVNTCLNQAQVVSKQAYDAGAASLWPYCDGQCTACMPPAVDVVCSNGQCGLEKLDPMDASADKMTSHCGIDSMPVVAPVKTLIGCN